MAAVSNRSWQIKIREPKGFFVRKTSERVENNAFNVHYSFILLTLYSNVSYVIYVRYSADCRVLG